MFKYDDVRPAHKISDSLMMEMQPRSCIEYMVSRYRPSSPRSISKTVYPRPHTIDPIPWTLNTFDALAQVQRLVLQSFVERDWSSQAYCMQVTETLRLDQPRRTSIFCVILRNLSGPVYLMTRCSFARQRCQALC